MSTPNSQNKNAGADFRERERIRRKAARWREGLMRLPDTERYAVMAAIDELRAGGQDAQGLQRQI